MTQKLASSKGRLASFDNLYLVVQGSPNCFGLQAFLNDQVKMIYQQQKLLYFCKYTENTGRR